MKNLLTLLFVLSFFPLSFSQVKNLNEDSTFFDFIELYAAQNDDSIPSKHIRRLEKMWGPRLAPSGDSRIAGQAMYEYAQNYSGYLSDTYTPNWEELGPIGTNSNVYFGQIHNIVFDPEYNITNHTIYACTSFGGLWRSVDDGNSWSNVNTDTGIPVCSVSDLAIHPQNSDVLFLSTGYADSGVSRYYTKAGAVNPIFSVGVYRSTDYGVSWHPINTGLEDVLEQGMNIREIEINPENPDQIFIATDEGIFRTNNANDAVPVWYEVLNTTRTDQIFDSEMKGLEFKPGTGNSDTVYASGRDIYISTDGGDSWHSMTDSNIYPGLDLENLMEPLFPDETESAFTVDRINITVTPASENRVYAYIDGTERYLLTVDGETTVKHRDKVYIYMFNGTEWEELVTHINNYDNYTRLAIAVPPNNANAVYYGTTVLRGCNDITTENFIELSYYSSGWGDGYAFHSDIHALEFQPDTTNPQLFCGNDGGISVKSPPFNNTGNWEPRNEGLGISTVWSFDDSESNAHYILSGFQDNGVFSYFDGLWEKISGGDGYGTQINDINDKNAFIRFNRWLFRYNYETDSAAWESSNCEKGYIRYGPGDYGEIIDYRPYDTLTAGDVQQRAHLTLDFEIKNEPKSGDMYWTYSEIYKRLKEVPDLDDKFNPSNLYERVSDIILDTVQYRRQFNRFEISEADPDYRYVIKTGANPATEDINPYKTHLYRVTDGSNDYEEVNSPWNEPEDDYALVSDIVVDPLNPERIWISFTGYNQNYRVYYSPDAGDTWENYDPNNKLPRLPVNAITYQKGSNDILYIATDAGVYVKNGTADWERYGNDCPNVIVQDLKINYCNNKLRIATFGRGIWQADIIETDQDLPEIAFEPGDISLWDEDVDRGLRNNVRIKTGHEFTIKGKISMPANGKITVEPGAKLIIDGGTLTQNCGKLWQGIVVLGNNNLPQTEDNQGVVEVINGGTIEHAEIGILAANSNYQNSTADTGGIIKVNNAVFRDNITGIKMPEYHYDNTSYIKNSLFETSLDYAFDTHPYAYIELDKVGTIDIEGNTFQNLLPLDPSHPQQQGKGIIAIDADISVKPFCSTPQCEDEDMIKNEFKNLYKAIDVQGTGHSISTFIEKNIFTDNWVAVYLNNADGAEVLSNSMDIFSCQDNRRASGIFLIQTNRFHVEDNSIWSDALNLATGIYVVNCNEDNEIYRNYFDDIYTGVYSQGENANGKSGQYKGLQILCNVFENVENDIYVAPGSHIATYQGSHFLTAGNQFIPDCSNSTNEFYNSESSLYYIINYFKHDDADSYYVPDCKEGVNLFNAEEINNCASQLTLTGNYNAKLATLDTGIQDTKVQLSNLIDGGDTSGLNETVEDSESSEALKLRNELLSRSPSLSDSTMVHITKVEEVLPSIMVKQVLTANPSSAKSSKVQIALDERQNQLPAYMRDEINLGNDTISYKEELESQLSYLKYKRENLIDRKLVQLKLSGTAEALDSIKTILTAEAENNLKRKYQLVDYYLSRYNSQDAHNVFASIPVYFELSESQQNEYNKLEQLYNIRFALDDENKTWYGMNESQRSIIENLATDSTSTAGMRSRAVLSLVDRKDYGCYIPDIQHDITPKNAYLGVEESFKVYPKQANDYFIIEYALGEDERMDNVQISIFDDRNHQVDDMSIRTRANQFLIECENWKEGIYWVRKTVGNMVTEQEQVIINRKSIPDNSVRGTNSLVLFPNPNSDYLYVNFNISGYDSVILRATDSKGALIAEYILDDTTMQINTTNWESGVYTISILNNDKILDTAKIIVK